MVGVGDLAAAGKVNVTVTNPDAWPPVPEAGARSIPIGPVGICPRFRDFPIAVSLYSPDCRSVSSKAYLERRRAALKGAEGRKARRS